MHGTQLASWRGMPDLDPAHSPDSGATRTVGRPSSLAWAPVLSVAFALTCCGVTKRDAFDDTPPSATADASSPAADGAAGIPPAIPPPSTIPGADAGAGTTPPPTSPPAPPEDAGASPPPIPPDTPPPVPPVPPGPPTPAAMESPFARACAAPTGGTLPAFPCAEGFGAQSVGGRGGDVYHVTSLSDSGDGSLREGIESARGPRTIVFDVGGTIVLRSRLIINRPNLTIAGQTAPGGGITIRDDSVDIDETHDIVIRFVRFRRGDVRVRAGSRPTGSIGLDTISIDDSENVIIDHCSLSWSCDEILGIVQNRNVTIQWSIVSEPLGDPELHPYGDDHAYGLNTSANTLSFHHSLVFDYVMRGPQFEANDATSSTGHTEMESVNNVLYGYTSSGSRYTTGNEDGRAPASTRFRFHFVNNRFFRAPGERAPDIQAAERWGVSDQVRVYVAGNIGPLRPTDDMDDWASVMTQDGGDPIRSAPSNVRAQMSDAPLFSSPFPVTTSSADAAHRSVLANAGVTTVRDAVDQRVLGHVMANRFPDTLHSQSDVGGWPDLDAGTAAPDSDGDGMSDDWEMSVGLNPREASDGNDDYDGDGYTNLEEYLEHLVPLYVE